MSAVVTTHPFYPKWGTRIKVVVQGHWVEVGGGGEQSVNKDGSRVCVIEAPLLERGRDFGHMVTTAVFIF